MKKNIKINLILLNIIIETVLLILLYFLLPNILNYSPDTVNQITSTKLVNISYNFQFFLLWFIDVMLNIVLLSYGYKDINKYNYYIIKNDYKSIINLKILILNAPYKLLKRKLIFVTIINVLVYFLLPEIITFSLFIIVFSICMLFSLIAVTIYNLATKLILDNLLKKLNINNEILGIKTTLLNNLMLQILPVSLITIVVIIMLNQTKITNERADTLYYLNKTKLEDLKSESDALKDKNFFYINLNTNKSYNINNDSIIYKSIKLINDKNRDRYYELTKNDQAVIKRVYYEEMDYIIGYKYKIEVIDLIKSSIITIIIAILIISVAIIYYVSIITKSLKFVIKEMKKINNDGEISFKTLPITSTDEIGILSKEFNSIENKIILYIEQIKSSQNVLIKKDSLTSLGQLAGGIAHDLNTPLGAIDANIMIIKDMITDIKSKEIDNDTKNSIIDIESRIDKINVVKGKMLNIVNSVRNHMRNISGDEIKLFSPIECINNMRTIINHQLIKNNCNLIIEDIPDIKLLGDATKFEQVITNLVINAIQAYQNKGGTIKIYGAEKEDEIILCVEDKAGGIPTDIQEGIFKNILTTKGIEGTGLGLYLVSSIITGHFNGKIEFKVNDGVGTIFIIKIPITKNK